MKYKKRKEYLKVRIKDYEKLMDMFRSNKTGRMFHKPGSLKG